MRSERHDITDFLTDGSLAGLCAAAQRITGVPIALRSVDGDVVAGDAPPLSRDDEFSAGLRVHSGPIGALVVPRHAGNGAPARQEVQRFLTLLASVVGEICDRDLEVHERLDELAALYKLSSMLVGVTDIDRILSAGVELAVEVLGVDAGAVRLLTENGAALDLAAAHGLSDTYIQQTKVVATAAAADSAALDGRVVHFEDILREGRPIHPEAMSDEGLCSMISAGLCFRDEQLGVLRLFTRLPRSFTKIEQRLILSFAQQLAAALASARLLEAEARSAEINRQVRMARAVQRRMMPEEQVAHPGLDIAARYLSSQELGGDFFDLFDADGALAIVVGDVVGKGVAAAMLMSSVRATIRTLIDSGLPLDKAVERANKALTRDSRQHEFVTVFAALIDPDARALRYVSAGHEPALLIRANPNHAPASDGAEPLTEGGMLIGVEPDQTYETGRAALHPGDTLIAYTDGLNEAMNFDNELFTRKRVRRTVADILRNNPDASAERIADQTLWAMRCFTGIREQSDDVTLVVVRVNA